LIPTVELCKKLNNDFECIITEEDELTMEQFMDIVDKFFEVYDDNKEQ